MFEIDKKGNIYHTRGDTAGFDVNVTIDGEVLDEYEAVFSVKKRYEDTEYLLQVPVVDKHVTIPHTATQNLPFGNFFYDIEIIIPKDEADTEDRYVTIGPYAYYLKPDITTT